MADDPIKVNRAPVLTLWAAVVAERMGYDREAALTLGKGVAGLNAQSKGRRLGIYKPSEEEKAESKERRTEQQEEAPLLIPLLGRSVTARRTRAGLRALSKGDEIDPESVERYIERKFGKHLDEVRQAMKDLAASFSEDDLENKAYTLYEKFRPEIPEGKKGWGAAGKLDLETIRSLKQNK